MFLLIIILKKNIMSTNSQGKEIESYGTDEEDQKAPLLSIEIQLSETETATLNIMEDDVIEERVDLFCKENNLTEEAKKVITDQVTEQLNAQIDQCIYS